MNEKITELKINGKTQGWYGKRFPKTAQEILDEVEKEMNAKYAYLNKTGGNTNGTNKTK